MNKPLSRRVAVPLHRFVVRFRWHARRAGGLFLGLRVSLNDIAGSELLVGLGQDLQHSGRFFSLDASRRVGSNVRLALKLRMIDSSAEEDPLAVLSKDDHLIVEYTYYF